MPSPHGAIQEWRDSADALLRLSERAAPLTDETFRGAFGSEDPEVEIDRKVDTFLSKSVEALVAVEAARGAPAAELTRPETIDVLLSNIEVADAMLAGSEPPDDALRSPAVFGERPVRFAAARARMDELESAMRVSDGDARALAGDERTVVLAELTTALDDLQNAGADELLALGRDGTVVGALGAGMKTLAQLGGKKVEEAFAALKGVLTLLKRGAIRILEWVVDRLHSLVPAGAQGKIDDLIEKARGKLADGARQWFRDTIGDALGRDDVEKAWNAATDMTSARAALPGITQDHLTRIGYCSSARKVVGTFGGAVATVLGTAAPAVRIVVLALVLAAFAFVGYQVYDGFVDIGNLV